jgi:Xaa-Pro aminopeptidase
MWTRGVIVFVCLLGAGCTAQPQAPTPKVEEQKAKVRSIREQADALFDFNIKRVDRLLLPAMRKAGIDCWITMSREHNIDPVFQYIMDSDAEGGHRNAFIFFDDGSDRVKRILIGTHLPRTSKIWDKIVSYPSTTDPLGPSLKPALKQTIEELQPKKIGINESRTIPIADGLTVQMKQFLIDAVGPKYAARLVSAEQLIVDFLDTRLPEEQAWFTEAAAITEMLASEVMSNLVITPGKTTIGDAKWYVRNRMAELKVQTWFPVGVSVYRRGAKGLGDSSVIEPGDLMHTDLGIIYAGLYTDYQRSGYVLKPGETDAPAGFKTALANAVKGQEVLAQAATVGKAGTAVKQDAEEAGRKSGLTLSIGCHSIAAAGHGIGAWFNQYWPDRYSERTKFPVRLGAYYAAEFGASTAIPEWDGETLRLGVEDSAYATETGLKYFIPPQEKFYLIKSGQGS